MSDCTGCQNLSNPTHQGTREMCQIVQDVRTCLSQHTKGPGKCGRLYRMSDISGFILVNRNTLWPEFFVRCHRMPENSGVGLHKLHCSILYMKRDQSVQAMHSFFIVLSCHFLYSLLYYNVVSNHSFGFFSDVNLTPVFQAIVLSSLILTINVVLQSAVQQAPTVNN